MNEARSKRRILPLIFIIKSFKKPLLIRVLKRDNQLHLSSAARSRLIAMAPSNFFAFVKTLISHLLSPKLIKTNVANGNISSGTFSKNVLAEELRQKRRLSVSLKSETNSIYDDIRQTW